MEQVVEVQRRVTEELVRALIVEREQIALDGADAGGGNIAILRGELRGVVADVLQHGAEIF